MYYYQVQCQLGISGFFVVRTTNSVHIEEIQLDISFFEANVTIANTLVEKAVLPEIIGCWLTKPREEFVVASEHTQTSSMRPAKVNNEGAYCYCNGVDKLMIICCALVNLCESIVPSD